LVALRLGPIVGFVSDHALAVIDLEKKDLADLLRLIEESPALCRRLLAGGNSLKVAEVAGEIFGPAAAGRNRVVVEQAIDRRALNQEGTADQRGNNHRENRER